MSLFRKLIKKKYYLVFACIFSLSCVSTGLAEEIRLFDLPWDSDVFAVERALDDMGFDYVSSYETGGLSIDTYNASNDSVLLSSNYITDDLCGYLTNGFFFSTDKTVNYEGLNASSVLIYSCFHIDDDGTINRIKPKAAMYSGYISLSVEQNQIDDAYDNLTLTFESKYGKYRELWGIGETHHGNAIISCDAVKRIFYGDNNTMASIEKMIYRGRPTGIVVVYGKLGTDDLLHEITKKVSMENVEN